MNMIDQFDSKGADSGDQRVQDIDQTLSSSLAKDHRSLTPNLEHLEERRRQRDEISRAMLSRNAIDR